MPRRVADVHESWRDFKLTLIHIILQGEVVHEALVQKPSDHHVQQPIDTDQNKDVPSLIHIQLLADPSNAQNDQTIRDVAVSPSGKQRRGVWYR
jgi:hypothetical protein